MRSPGVFGWAWLGGRGWDVNSALVAKSHPPPAHEILHVARTVLTAATIGWGLTVSPQSRVTSARTTLISVYQRRRLRYREVKPQVKGLHLVRDRDEPPVLGVSHLPWGPRLCLPTLVWASGAWCAWAALMASLPSISCLGLASGRSSWDYGQGGDRECVSLQLSSCQTRRPGLWSGAPTLLLLVPAPCPSLCNPAVVPPLLFLSGASVLPLVGFLNSTYILAVPLLDYSQITCF